MYGMLIFKLHISLFVFRFTNVFHPSDKHSQAPSLQYFITSTEEALFSPVPVVVVCLSAGLHKNYSTDFSET